jgi:ribonuclease HI
MHILFFDGCSKGNPGMCGCGAVLYDDEGEKWQGNHYLGHNTNNVSEYYGLIMGLTQVVAMGIKELTVKGDSLLIINQMKGYYKVKSKRLIPYYNQAKKLEEKIEKIHFIHVKRNENKRADELANLAVNYI